MPLVFFRHGGTALLAVGVLALILAWLAGAATFSPGEIVLGALLFYVSEYLMHRFAFHAPPAPWAFVRKLQHRLHYDHHAEPGRLDLRSCRHGSSFPILREPRRWSRCFSPRGRRDRPAGRDAGDPPLRMGPLRRPYPDRPLTPVGRWIKQYHFRHHFISEKLWFGVSNPLLDFVFGTYGKARDVERSATTRKLHS